MTDPPVPVSDPLELATTGLPLDADEARYVAAARAANTLRGYRSDWAEWCAWARQHGHRELPADPTGISRYLTSLAGHGAKVGTMSRRLSAIRFAHRIRNRADPTDDARVAAVWEGIRRTHDATADQALPLMPPDLLAVVDAAPTTRTWANGRPSEPDLAGLRDRALLMVGFCAALRRGELAALSVENLVEHPHGAVITIARSKTNQTGATPELVVLPRAARPAYCPVVLVEEWLQRARISTGPLLRSVDRHNRPGRQLSPAAINQIVQRAIARAGLDPSGYSAHSLRAGFVTFAHLRGASDRAIAHQTRHRSMASLGQYVRIHEAWQDNAATQLGL